MSFVEGEDGGFVAHKVRGPDEGLLLRNNEHIVVVTECRAVRKHSALGVVKAMCLDLELLLASDHGRKGAVGGMLTILLSEYDRLAISREGILVQGYLEK